MAAPAVLSALLPFLKPAITAALSGRLKSKKDITDTVTDVLSVLSTNEKEMNETLLEINKAQIAVNAEAAKHKSIFVAGARPFILWTCGVAFAWHFLFEPIIVFILAAFNVYPDFPVFDTTALTTLLLGLLGMSGIRSFDKLKGTTK